MAALDSWPGKRYAITTWMSVPALASGARALARMPVLFSTSFLHNTILFTVTAIVSPSFSSQNSLAFFLGRILLRSYEGCNTTNSIYYSWICDRIELTLALGNSWIDQWRNLLFKNPQLLNLIFYRPDKNPLNTGGFVRREFFRAHLRRADKKPLAELLDRSI